MSKSDDDKKKLLTKEQLNSLGVDVKESEKDILISNKYEEYKVKQEKNKQEIIKDDSKFIAELQNKQDAIDIVSTLPPSRLTKAIEKEAKINEIEGYLNSLTPEILAKEIEAQEKRIEELEQKQETKRINSLTQEELDKEIKAQKKRIENLDKKKSIFNSGKKLMSTVLKATFNPVSSKPGASKDNSRRH